MVSRVAFAFFVGHYELLFIAFGVGCSNDNADAAPKYFMRKMLPRIVLKRCVILKFLRPLLTRSCSPGRLSVTLASRSDRLGKSPQASTEWSVAKHQRDLADLLNKILVDFDFSTQGNTAAQMISMYFRKPSTMFTAVIPKVSPW